MTVLDFCACLQCNFGIERFLYAVKKINNPVNVWAFWACPTNHAVFVLGSAFFTINVCNTVYGKYLSQQNVQFLLNFKNKTWKIHPRQSDYIKKTHSQLIYSLPFVTMMKGKKNATKLSDATKNNNATEI